jgi:hypothetical protein
MLRIVREDSLHGPSSASELIEFFSKLSLTCQSSDLVRIGGTGDGTYLVPVSALSGIHACFSPGYGGIANFETDLYTTYGIFSYICDSTSPLPEDELCKGFKFTQKRLTLEDSESTHSLSQWINSCRPNSLREKYILQMDIEGDEWEVLYGNLNLLNERFQVIVLELHDLEQCKSYFALKNKFIPVLHRLLESFCIVSANGNRYIGQFVVKNQNFPRAIEITLIHKNICSHKRNFYSSKAF